MRLDALVLATLVAVLTSFPSLAQNCPPSIPPDSPVLAPSLDNIPPGSGQIINYQGSYFSARANGRFAVVQTGENEQKVWFGADSAPPDGRVYYNRRYRANSSSPWYWQYSTSITIIDHGDSSTGPNTVLYSPTPKYKDNSWTGGTYKYLMYSVSQPRECDGVVLGFLYVSFSNDGICWTPISPATRVGGPSFPCLPDVMNTVPVETAAAIDGGDTIYLMGIEGNGAELIDYTQMDRTQTYIGVATPANPEYVTLLWSPAEVSAAGVVSPSGVTSGPYLERFRPYKYFMNMDMAYDAATGYLYVGRAYPYAYDRWGSITTPVVPCAWQSDVYYLWDWMKGQNAPVQGCLAAPGTLPNRIQVYRMYIGALSNFGALASGTWTLVSDLGGDAGYTNGDLGSCSSNPYTPRTDPRQQNVGRDYAYVNFVRDAAGLLVPNGIYGSLLAGDSYKLSKGVGYCYVTGNESVALVNFTR